MNMLSEQIIGLYERHAKSWDADRATRPWHEKPWHDRFADLLPKGSAILDLGCGSGAPVARHLADRGFQITGVDSSPTMISLCRERLPGHRWLVADMRSLPLRERFSGILAWDSYFHLNHDDQRWMFGVFASHAAPGALLMFNTGHAHGEAIGNYRGEPLYHASLDAAEYTTLLDQSDFDPVAHAVKDAKAGGRTVWLARSRRAV